MRPILYFNTSEDDKRAYLLVKSSSIPCEFRCPCLDDKTPMLWYDYNRYVGLDEIKSFIAQKK